MIRVPPQGSAKPRGTPNPEGCQRYCCLWSQTLPCRPCLKRDRKRFAELKHLHHREREEADDVLHFFFFTLSSYNQTCHAVWNAGPRCQEGYAHDVVWDVQCVADDGDLKQQETSGSSIRLQSYLCDVWFLLYCKDNVIVTALRPVKPLLSLTYIYRYQRRDVYYIFLSQAYCRL